MTTPFHYGATNKTIRSTNPGRPRTVMQFLVIILSPAVLLVALQRISLDQPLQPGDQSPNLTLRTESDSTISLTPPHHQPLAVLFFSADCPHCKRELKNVELLRELFGRKVGFLLVSQSERRRTNALLDSLGIDTPVAFDDQRTAHTAFGVFSVPALYLINTNGIIQTASFGERPLGVRRKQVESFLLAAEMERHKPENEER